MYAYLLKSEGSYNTSILWNIPGNMKSGTSGVLKSIAASSSVPDPTAFEKNMTVIGVVHLDGSEISSEKDSLILIKSDTVVGLCTLKFREELNRYLASFMIYGHKDGDVYDVYLYNYGRDSRYPISKQIIFEGNKVLGSWDKPYRFLATKTTGVNNPISDVHGLRAWMDNTERICKVEFYSDRYADHKFGIYDMLGQEVITVEYHSHTGENYLEIQMADEKFTSGIYLFRSLKDNSKVVKLFVY